MQVAGRCDGAAEHDDFRIDRRRQVGDRHADVFRGVADDRDRTPSPAARALEYEGAGDGVERPADGVEHGRAIAGLDAPRAAARDAFRGDFRGEAAKRAIVLALDGVEREPAGGAGPIVRAEPRFAVDQQARR